MTSNYALVDCRVLVRDDEQVLVNQMQGSVLNYSYHVNLY